MDNRYFVVNADVDLSSLLDAQKTTTTMTTRCGGLGLLLLLGLMGDYIVVIITDNFQNAMSFSMRQLLPTYFKKHWADCHSLKYMQHCPKQSLVPYSHYFNRKSVV